ncbi:MAG: response regulator transcription factor [Cohaesibacteraceae bacterium]|nr:response regulator transcription factor [Cohaesibacteraceae bacterium]
MNIIIADDHPVFRAGLAVILKQVFVDAVFHEASCGEELNILLTKFTSVELLLVDLFFPGFKYSHDLPRYRKMLPLSPIIAVSMMNDRCEIEKIMSFGINGFISKSISPARIVQSIQAVMQGDVIIATCDHSLEPGIDTHIQTGDITAEGNIQSQYEALPPRQQEVLHLLGKGLSNKEIARELDLSPFTIRAHVSAVLKALGVANRSAASALVGDHDIVSNQ